MSATAFVHFPKNVIVSGQTISGEVIVTNSSGTAVTLTGITVYPAGPQTPSMTQVQLDLGAGAGGAAATIPSVQSTINDGSSKGYAFSFQAFGAMPPGSTPLQIWVEGCVTLSDGTSIPAQPAKVVVEPALSVTADTVNSQVNILSKNPALILDVSRAGTMDFQYPQESGLVVLV